MPRVPSVDGPSVQLNAAPNAYQRTPENIGAAGMTQARQLGAASQVAGAWSEVQQQEVDRMDQARLLEARTRAKEIESDLTFGKDRGFTNLKGIAALQREGGQPLAEEYTQSYKKALDEITADLGSPRQKALFQQWAGQEAAGFRTSATRYEGEQARVYQRSAADGAIAGSRDTIGRFYNDPAKIDDELRIIDAAVRQRGSLDGLAAIQVEALARKETSNALTVAIGAALEQNDVTLAGGLLQKYSKQMDADDLLRVRSVFDKQADTAIALKAATDVVQRTVAPAVQPSDFGRLVAITMQSESGGRRFGADGKLLTSPAGAKGEMQVLDGTNRDPGYGVTPARDDSPEERARVGRDYLAAMVKNYDGDLAKAWAAYNAGPGRVDQELKDAAKRGQPDAWLSNMPAETQAYVAKNMRAYQAGEGRPQMPTLADVHAAVREQVGTGSPQRLKLAMDEATRQFEATQKAVKQREDEATTNAYRWLASNGGRTSLMPPSVREAVPPKELDNLLSFGQRIAKGEDRTNPAVYQMMADPDFLKSLSNGQFFRMSMAELSEADRKHFALQRGRLLGERTGDRPDDLNQEAVKTLLDSRLREVGINPTPTPRDQQAAMRVGAIRSFVDRSILAAQQSAGKRFSDVDLQRHIDGLLAQTDVVKSWGSGTSQPMLTMQHYNISDDVKDRLVKDFKANGIDKPTDGQILGAYFQTQEAKKKVREIKPLPVQR